LKPFDCQQALQEIFSLTRQRDSLIEQSVNNQYRKRFQPSGRKEGKVDEWNYGSTMIVARSLALHDPAIAVFQKRINQKIAELDLRVNLRKAAQLVLKERVQESPLEISGLEEQKRKWENQFAHSVGAQRKQAQGMLRATEKQLVEKRRELKAVSEQSASEVPLLAALGILAGKGFEANRLGFAGNDHAFLRPETGEITFLDMGLRKKQRKTV
jgi:hypothetical protein